MKSNSKLFLCHGDITTFHTEALVNPANTSLLGGGGVDGLIHRKGGKQILDDCIKIRARQGGCKVGEAVITRAGKLSANYVIHTVGPTWVDGHSGEEELLEKTYISCLELATVNNIQEMLFPNISTGRYKFPKVLAAKIAITTVINYLTNNDVIKKVGFVCYENEDYVIYQEHFKKYALEVFQKVCRQNIINISKSGF